MKFILVLFLSIYACQARHSSESCSDEHDHGIVWTKVSSLPYYTRPSVPSVNSLLSTLYSQLWRLIPQGGTQGNTLNAQNLRPGSVVQVPTFDGRLVSTPIQSISFAGNQVTIMTSQGGYRLTPTGWAYLGGASGR